MSAYNNFMFIKGNVGKEAEIKEIPDVGTVATFPMAVYRTGKGESAKTDWFRVEAWHNLARGMEDIPKGTRLIVKGQMKADTVDKEGGKITYYTFVASDIGKDISISKEGDGEPF